MKSGKIYGALLASVLVWSAIEAVGSATHAQEVFCRTTATGDKQACTRPVLSSGEARVDTLSEQDIPTGDGGFFRDYQVNLQAGDNVAIDLESNEFDPIVSLIKPDGTPLGDNDDAPGGGTNSLLFTRIKESGAYIVRVRSFGETGGGEFTLTVTRLVPVD
jgi:hypothetical protein